MISQQPQFVSLPALFQHKLRQDFCLLSSGQRIDYASFFHHAFVLSQHLPAQNYALNLCQDRYLFMVAYLAVLLRQQITLLPSNQAPQTIKQLLANYHTSYCICDISNENSDKSFLLSWGLLSKLANAHCSDFENQSLIDTQKPMSISFTSGSSGEPKAISKTWAEFQCAAQLAINALNLQNKSLTLVSTVPAQHMYGLETSLFWVLFSELTIHNSRPFYPEDIRLLLQNLPHPVLISTPTHLKSCVQNQCDWAKMPLILSSTAPLSLELATEIEQRFHAPLLEIYGSTETLSFATRQVCINPLWQPYQGITLFQQKKRFFVQGGHLPVAVPLDDDFKITESGLFQNLGRNSDLIKIGGKRASLAELNRILTQLPIVKDGVFFKLKNDRLAALVVSDASKNAIITALKPALDAVFLPRVIYRVAKLPHNATGKISKAELEHFLKELQSVAD